MFLIHLLTMLLKEELGQNQNESISIDYYQN